MPRRYVPDVHDVHYVTVVADRLCQMPICQDAMSR
jgi:hypothetical protein